VSLQDTGPAQCFGDVTSVEFEVHGFEFTLDPLGQQGDIGARVSRSFLSGFTRVHRSPSGLRARLALGASFSTMTRARSSVSAFSWLR
jgi:hypothetical protein